MGKPRRSFTREFKVEAVKLVTEQGRSFAEAAANLGIAENLLHKWKQNLDAEGNQAFPGKSNLPALEEELRRLHLAAVEDLYARQIVGWSLSERMSSRLVVDAWRWRCRDACRARDWWRTRIAVARMPATTTSGCWSGTASPAA